MADYPKQQGRESMPGHAPRGGVGIYKVEGGKLTCYRDYMDPAE